MAADWIQAGWTRCRLFPYPAGKPDSGAEVKENLRIDGSRLWDSLMEMAKIGATEKGGVCRLTLTDLDRQSRDLFVRWCEEAGCTVTVDDVGNIFARRPGRDRSEEHLSELPSLLRISYAVC